MSFDPKRNERDLMGMQRAIKLTEQMGGKPEAANFLTLVLTDPQTSPEMLEMHAATARGVLSGMTASAVRTELQRAVEDVKKSADRPR